MDGDLGRAIAEQRGFFYRWQALDDGYSPGEIDRALRAGEWVRLRRGAYTTATHLASLDAMGLHALEIRAAIGRLAGQVVVIGPSALIVRGVPTWGVDLKRLHVTREAGRSSRTDADVVHHVTPIPDSQLIECDGLVMTIAERSLIDAARVSPFEAGVVMGDGAKRLFPFDDDLARGIVENQRDWPGSLKANRVLRFADGDAETVGESRSRVMIARIGLPKPKLQKKFRRSDGTEWARTDFYFERFATVGEFDGRQKYGREFYERTGSLEQRDLGETLWQEKVREDALRDGGCEVVRWVWSELDGHDDTMRRRFDRAFGRAELRSNRQVS